MILYEAYMQLNYFSRANLRVGKFKPPVGLERLQSDDDTSFIERGSADAAGSQPRHRLPDLAATL